MKYPVNEIIYTWQGEGCNHGRPATFIRLHGCPVHCTFCDSAGTWHPDYVPKKIPRLDAGEILQQVGRAPLVVITGGEPAIHDLRPLTMTLIAAGKTVAIETCGAFPLQGDFHWVTVSPKRAAPPIASVLQRATEFKFVIEARNDIWVFLDMVETGMGLRTTRTIWLHPEWSVRESALVLTGISDAVKQMGRDFRAGYQLHKLYGVDQQDARCMPTAPLGGVARQ